MSKGTYFIYGTHACLAALQNPRRQIKQIYVIKERPDIPSRAPVKIVDKRFLDSLVGGDAVHQGIICEVVPLIPVLLDTLEENIEPNQRVLCLDQVTDPHNVGAILRSAAAFGAKAVVMTDRQAPSENGALAKAASGALEQVPLIRVVNLVHGLTHLKDMGFWTIAFMEAGQQELRSLDLSGKIALILGSEGDGLRRLTHLHADFSAVLPTNQTFTTLNVSNAAAIALYETFLQQR